MEMLHSYLLIASYLFHPFVRSYLAASAFSKPTSEWDLNNRNEIKSFESDSRSWISFSMPARRKCDKRDPRNPSKTLNQAFYDPKLGACVALDHSDEVLPILEDCPIGSVRSPTDYYSCAGRIISDLEIKCPKNWNLNVDEECINSIVYAIRNKPVCPEGFTLHRSGTPERAWSCQKELFLQPTIVHLSPSGPGKGSHKRTKHTPTPPASLRRSEGHSSTSFSVPYLGRQGAGKGFPPHAITMGDTRQNITEATADVDVPDSLADVFSYDELTAVGPPPEGPSQGLQAPGEQADDVPLYPVSIFPDDNPLARDSDEPRFERAELDIRPPSSAPPDFEGTFELRKLHSGEPEESTLFSFSMPMSRHEPPVSPLAVDSTEASQLERPSSLEPSIEDNFIYGGNTYGFSMNSSQPVGEFNGRDHSAGGSPLEANAASPMEDTYPGTSLLKEQQSWKQSHSVEKKKAKTSRRRSESKVQPKRNNMITITQGEASQLICAKGGQLTEVPLQEKNKKGFVCRTVTMVVPSQKKICKKGYWYTPLNGGLCARIRTSKGMRLCPYPEATVGPGLGDWETPKYKYHAPSKKCIATSALNSFNAKCPVGYQRVKHYRPKCVRRVVLPAIEDCEGYFGFSFKWDPVRQRGMCVYSHSSQEWVSGPGWFSQREKMSSSRLQWGQTPFDIYQSFPKDVPS